MLKDPFDLNVCSSSWLKPKIAPEVTVTVENRTHEHFSVTIVLVFQTIVSNSLSSWHTKRISIFYREMGSGKITLKLQMWNVRKTTFPEVFLHPPGRFVFKKMQSKPPYKFFSRTHNTYRFLDFQRGRPVRFLNVFLERRRTRFDNENTRSKRRIDLF